ncbi:MAG: hypothetical protein OXK17_04975 [Thaumarchaeota archaeon]|nr:hypothetical protein [Nitrososphaerota archaeon]
MGFVEDFVRRMLDDLGMDCPVGLVGCRALGPCSFEPCAYDVMLFDGNTPLGDTVIECDGDGDGADATAAVVAAVDGDDDDDDDDDGSGNGNGNGNGVRAGTRRRDSRRKKLVITRHASLSESDSGRLLQYDAMRVLHDPSWDLRMMLQRIEKRRGALYRDLARNSLLQSMFCCQRAQSSDGGAGDRGSVLGVADARGQHDGSGSPDMFAPCWQKCASLYLADAICALNCKRPSPSHMLEVMRGLPKSPVNAHFSVVSDTMGIERATPTLLERMTSSTAGFADHECVAGGTKGGLGSSAAISSKHDYFISESMMTDCYFYLCYVNKENMSRVQSTLHRNPGLFHILRVALDVERDDSLLQKNAAAVQESCRMLLESLSGRGR